MPSLTQRPLPVILNAAPSSPVILNAAQRSEVKNLKIVVQAAISEFKFPTALAMTGNKWEMSTQPNLLKMPLDNPNIRTYDKDQ